MPKKPSTRAFGQGVLAQFVALAIATPLFSCVSPDGLDDPSVSETSQGLVVTSEVVTQDAGITVGGDHYVHTIDLTSGGWCEFETTPATMPDTVMWLKDSALSVLAFDDDSGPGSGSRIVRNLVPGRYYVDITGFSTVYTGTWQLAVACGTDPVFFHENFTVSPGGDAGQCGGQTGIQSAIMGTWTRNVLIDVDGRAGWCDQSFGVTDPQSIVAGLSLAVNFYGDGDATQCVNSGYRAIPVSSANDPTWSSALGIDTDNRGGGCWQVFYLSGRTDVAMDVEFLPSPGGDGGQCGNQGTYTVTSDAAKAFRLDTDSRAGGCTQRFRLKRRPACTPRTTCSFDECGIVSDGCGGTIDCGTCGGGGTGGGCLTAPTGESNFIQPCTQ